MPRPTRREREALAEEIRRADRRRAQERRAWLQAQLAQTTWPRQPLRLPLGVGAGAVAAVDQLRSSDRDRDLPGAA